MPQRQDITVFMARRSPTCSECGDELGRGAWITLTDDKEALCLSCADLDHLVYLRRGDTALTRRSRKHSKLSAVVVQWARARKRYERQGVLVEREALEQAEDECLADEDARARQRERAALRRAELDREYVSRFAERINELYPGCPKKSATAIAEHACLKHSGRVGRSAAAKELDPEMVRLAVIAHIRHTKTRYDELLAMGYERDEARSQVEIKVFDTLAKWQKRG